VHQGIPFEMLCRVLLGVLHGVSQEELPIRTTREDAERAAVKQLAGNQKLQLSLLNCAVEVVAFACNPGSGSIFPHRA
jgi:hypothetical protein